MVNINAIDLNLLKAFEALLHESAVTRAGERIGLSQPAMSHALARLRQTFGDDLFVRTPNGMEPTPRARALAPHILDGLRAIRGALDTARPFLPAEAERAFVIGTAEYAEVALARDLLRVVRAEALAVDLRFVGTHFAEMGGWLDGGRIDLFVGHAREVPPRLCAAELYVSDLVLIARAGHPIFAAGISFAALTRWPHLLVSAAGDAHGATDIALRDQGLKRRVALTLSSYMSVPAVLRETDLIGCVPGLVGRRLLEAGGLALGGLPFDLPGPIKMIWHRRDDADGAHLWLRGRIAACFQGA